MWKTFLSIVYEDSHYSMSLPTLIIISPLNLSILNGEYVVFHCGFNLYFLDNWRGFSLFVNLLLWSGFWVLVSYWVVFFLMICRSLVCICYIKLHDIPRNYSCYNWKFVALTASMYFPKTLLPVPSNHQSIPCFCESYLFRFYM